MDERLHDQRDGQPAQVAGHPHDRARRSGQRPGEPFGGREHDRQRREQQQSHGDERHGSDGERAGVAAYQAASHADRHRGEHVGALQAPRRDNRREHSAADDAGHDHADEQQPRRGVRDTVRVQERLQPRGQGHEDPESEEHQAAQRAQLGDPPQGASGTAGDRRPLAARLPGAGQAGDQPDRRDQRQNRLDEQQALKLPVRPQGRAQRQRQQHADEVAGRADGDSVGPGRFGEVLAGQLPDGAEDHGLGDGDHHLSRQGPGERRAAQPHEGTERQQSRPGHQRTAEVTVKQRSGGDGQDHIQEGEDLRQPSHRGHGDAVAVGSVGGDSGKRQPQHLRGCRHQRIPDHDRPANPSLPRLAHGAETVRDQAARPYDGAKGLRAFHAGEGASPASPRVCRRITHGGL